MQTPRSVLRRSSRGPLVCSLLAAMVCAGTVLGQTPQPSASPAAAPPPAAAGGEAPSASSPAGPPFELPDTVATVDGEAIKKAELERVCGQLLASNGRSPTDLTDAERKKLYRSVLDELVTDRLVAKRSASVKISDADVEKRFDEMKGQASAEDLDKELKAAGQTLDGVKEKIRAVLQQEEWMRSQIDGQIKVSDADIEIFYKENPDFFKVPEKVHASHILIAVAHEAPPDIVKEKENLANSLAQRLKKGESFATLAKEFSEDADSKEKGGDLGLISREEMPPAVGEAAFKLKKGEVSAPIRTDMGFELFKVEDLEPAHVVPLADAKEKIRNYLQQKQRQDAASRLVAELHDKAKIEINVPQ